MKISDGCDRRCAFCAIPLIKGTYETVAPQAILAAAGDALQAGARELVLVGQDTTRWHSPGYGGLERLLGDLRALGALWLRLLYLQPDGLCEGGSGSPGGLRACRTSTCPCNTPRDASCGPWGAAATATPTWPS